MGHTYYFRNNETDFFKWCRHYVNRAFYYMKFYEKTDGSYFRIFGKEEYAESLVIVRQYQTLVASLPEEQRVFLDEHLIENKAYPVYRPPYNRYTKLIFENWQKICFPQNKSRVKTVDRFQLGKTIRVIREDCGFSRRQVADLLQINDKTLSAYENGTRLVRVDVLFGMAQLYKTSIDSIIERSIPVSLVYWG